LDRCTVADLKGKVLATNVVGSAVDIAMLRRDGLEANRDYTIIEALFPAMRAMLAEKKADLISAVPRERGNVRRGSLEMDRLGDVGLAEIRQQILFRQDQLRGRGGNHYQATRILTGAAGAGRPVASAPVAASAPTPN
jgi:hypothetical protein